MIANTYTFEVSIADWSAQIITSSKHTLYELAEAILDAVKFDMDHAFGFYEPDYFKSRRGQSFDDYEQYTLFADMDGADCAPHDEGVQDVQLGLVFEVGEPMIMLFDYGDDWRFTVLCTNIAMGCKMKKTKLVSTTGTPPEQYPDCE
jgi:hypothetical protein